MNPPDSFAVSSCAVGPTRIGFVSAWREPGTWVILLSSVLLWLAGYPPPHVDDLFFTGAAVELARSGQLSNPWIAPWLESLGTQHFFVHPPVYPYTLAVWLKVFGVSAATLTAFHLTVQTLVEVRIYGLLRAVGLSGLGSLAMATIVALFILSFGLRPEGLMILLVLASQLCLHREQRWCWLLGALLGAAAVLTHPIALTFVIPLHLLRFARLRRVRTEAVAFAVASLAGIGVAFICFVFAVRGQVAEFWRALTACSQLVAPPWRLAPSYFLGQITVGREFWTLGPCFLLIGLGAARACFPMSSHVASPRGLWLVWAFAVLLGVFLYPTRMVQYAAYGGLILAAVTWARSRWATPVIVSALLAVSVHDAGLLAGLIAGRTPPPSTNVGEQILQRHPHEVVCIDEVAARYLFDFRLPPGARSWTHRQRAQDGAHGLLATKPARELWIVDEWNLEHWSPDSRAHARRLRIGRFVFGSIPAVPRQLEVVD